MIYTVTFNPAIDYVMKMETPLEQGMTNRSGCEEFYFGGKGINVSLVLMEFGIESTALGFVAGFTGKAIDENVKAAGIKTDFITLREGNSRINIKLKGERETEVNAQGPKIGGDELDELFEKLDRLTKGDVLILAGSIPNSLPDDVYERILSKLDGRGIRFVVDATNDLLTNVLKYHPFLIKPNHIELGEIVGKELNTDDEIFDAAIELQGRGAVNVLISMAGNGAMLVDERGERHRIKAPVGEVKNSVGAGDSMVAGFLAGYMKSKDYEMALKAGTAAGSATAFSDGLAKKDEIEKVYRSL
ncbi:MAG: 1-phosphofructokinase [Eubacterium sp.]|nr:1-phosphofructokinase [Eubacterium sp.]